MADGVELFLDALPALEDAAAVGTEGDDVAEGLEAGEGFEEDDGVALAVAFDGRGEAGEAGADDEHVDLGGGFAGEGVGG